MLILGIETSCDETAAALVRAEDGALRVLADTVSSQIKIHAKWGGVVPSLAAREHVKNIVPVLDATFQKARLMPRDIDLIAVTHGPGLIPALLIGTNAAKTLAYLWHKPLLGIHHIEGHIYANFLSETGVNSQSQKPQIKFPILCLVVSGGHTQLILMQKHLDYEIIGETLDDAVGEAFDKAARILGLGYPGGPAIAAKAAELGIKNYELGNDTNKLRANEAKKLIKLPRPMIHKNNFDFSFSGLKTAVLYKVKELQKNNKNILHTEYQLLDAICDEFQQAAIDVLIHKTLRAAQKYNPQTIMLAGGVSANQELRRQLGEAIKSNLPNTKYQLPDTTYSIDNAAMIAAAGHFRWENMTARERTAALHAWKTLQADANLKIA